jgi:serine/threonine protein kinase
MIIYSQLVAAVDDDVTFSFSLFFLIIIYSFRIRRVGGGELFDRVIEDDFVLSERACAVFIRQICEALEYIHSKNIIHLDMKPENVLCLSKNGNRIKIIDFGLARFYDPKKKLQVGPLFCFVYNPISFLVLIVHSASHTFIPVCL